MTATKALGFSGGKDSTAAMIEARRQGELDIVYMCDTGNEDPLTYAYADLVSRKIHPIKTIRGDMLFYDLVKYKRFFPSRRRQYCTDYLKIQVSTRYLLSLGDDVIRIDGVRQEEGRHDNDRANIEEFGIDDFTGLEVHHIIHDWTLDQVWQAHRDALKIEDVIDLVINDTRLSCANKAELIAKIERIGIPCNPLYYMNARRVGCFPCVNAGRAEIRAILQFRPEKIDEIAEAEESIVNNVGYASMFHRNTVPERFRSQPIITKAGERMMLATIHDVARWARGKAYKPDQLEMHLPADIPQVMVCDRRGHCE